MKTRTIPFLFFLLFVLILCNTGWSANNVPSDKESNSFLRLWYKQPAEEWTEALPVGNGRIGAMIFGGVDTAQFQLNDATLWSGHPNDWNNPHAKIVLPEVRKALFAANYGEADELCKQMMGPYVAPYLTLGSLYLYFSPNKNVIKDYRRGLDLSDAVASVTYQQGNIHYSREVFSSYPDRILIIHLKADRLHAVSFSTHFNNPMPHKVEANGNNTVVMEGMAPSFVAHRSYHKPEIIYDSTKSMHFVVMIKAETKGGKVQSKNGALIVKNATEVTLFVSTGTTFNGFNKMPGISDKMALKEAKDNLAAASSKTFDELLKRHEKDYQNLFDRVKLNLGTGVKAYLPTNIRIKQYKRENYSAPELMTLLFQYGRYLLIASSRPSPQGSAIYGSPANLQGIWNNSMRPPWGSNYTTNINLEMNYWPAEKDNLSECAGPLIRFIKELSINGAITAKVNYGADGWVAHHNSDIWAQTAPVGNYGKDPQANPVWAMWPMAGAWLCRQLWEHYLFNGDTAFLREDAYPIMKGSARFMLSWLILWNGYLVTAPSTSPEHDFVINGRSYAVSVASTMDMSIIRDLFFNTIMASKILHTDAACRDSMQRAYKKLYLFHIGQYGQLEEWYKDWDMPGDHMRHISQLYGLFPAELISPIRTPLLAAAAKKSLEMRGDLGTGWSVVWKANCWARLDNGNHAYKLLNDELTAATPKYKENGHIFPNLLDAISGYNSPFQIDANFGFTSAVTEMLLQSQNGAVYLLPALPEKWQNGDISGLKSRGGFVIQNLRWEHGQLKSAIILSRLGGICRIRTNVPVIIKGANSEKVKEGTSNPNPFFHVASVGNVSVKEVSKIEKLSLPKTYLTDVQSKKGETFEVNVQ